MEAGLLTTLQRTSSIQGLFGQHLSSSQLSFSGAVAPPSLPGSERFCFLENSGHRAGPRAGGGLHYESHFSKWSFSGRKGFNGPAAAAEGEGGAAQTVRTQVRRMTRLQRRPANRRAAQTDAPLPSGSALERLLQILVRKV